MESNGGALHFDADIDNRKYLAKIVAMENRIELFVQNVLKANDQMDQSFARVTGNLNNGNFKNGISGMQNTVSSFTKDVLSSNRIIEESYSNLGQKFGSGKLKSGLNNLKTDFAGLGKAAVNGNNAAANSFSELADSAANSGASITSVFSGLTGVIAGFLSIQAAQGFVNQIIDIRTEFESLDVAFTTILKSKERADALMAEVVDFAATTPFGLTEVAKSTKQLLAYGVAAEDIKDELTTLGNIAAGVSQPIGEVAYLYGTLKTQGRAYAMDIRQFTGRGIPIIQELADVLGVAKNEVMGLVEEGKVGFPEVQKAFQNMTGSGGAFFDLMAKQALTTGGRISNLKDQIDLMFNSFGEANSGLINGGIAGIQLLVDNYQNVIDILTVMVAAYGTYRAALVLTAAVNKLNADATLAKIAALNGETAAEAASIATKQALIVQMGLARGATLSEAEAKAVSANAGVILALQEQAAITRKSALAASSAYYTAKTELEAAAKGGAAAATVAEMQAELALLATRKAEATQLATATRLELANIEAKTLNSAATAQLSAAEVVRAAGLGIAAKAQAIYNAVVAAAPMAAAIGLVVGLGAAIYALTQANNTASEAQERFNDISAEASIRRGQESAKVDEYVKIAKDATATDEERAKAIKKLNDLNPEFLGGLNAANIATQEGSKLIQAYLTDLNNKALGELAYAEKMNNTRKILELESKGTKAIDNWELLGTGLNNFFSGKIGIQSAKEGEEFLVNQKRTQLENANKKIDQKYGKQIREYQLKGLEGSETTAPPKSTKRTETFVKAEIKRLEELRSGYELNSKEYANYTAKIKGLNEELARAQGKVSSSDKKAISDRQAALNAIDKAETKSKQKALSDSQEKIQKAKDEAAELRKLAKKGGLGAGSLSKIDAIEKTNTGNIDYENNSDLLFKELNRQKEIYQKYEEYKTTVSKEEAEKRYKNEFSDFGALLKSNIDPLSNKKDITGPEQNRLNTLLEMQKQYNADVNNLEAKRYSEVFNATADKNQKIVAAEAKFQADLKVLGDNATNEQKQNLLATRNAAIDSAIEESNKKSKIYKDLNVEIIELTRERAKSEVEVIENMLKTAQGLTPEVRENLAQQLKYAKEVLAVGTNSAYVNELKKQKAAIEERIAKEKLSNAELQEYKDKLDEINGAIKKTGSIGGKVAKVGQDMAAIGGAFSELGAALEDTNPELAYTLTSLGDIAKVGADAAGAFASFASGDIIGGITGTVSAIAGLFSIGSKVKKMNEEARKEVAAFYETARLGELEYQALLRERERKLLEINAIGLKGIESQTNALKKQQDQINKDYQDTLSRLNSMGEGEITSSSYKHGTWLRKARTDYTYASLAGKNYDQLEQLFTQGKLTDGAKALFEELKRLKEEGADVEQALLDAATAAAELATGTTVENLSSSIISSLKGGKTGLKDVMDDYKTIIQDALLSTFKSDVVDVEMKAFYDRLSALAQSDGELTDDEIAQAQADYIATRERIKKEFENRQKVTGVDLTDGNTTESGVTASVKSITQDTAVAIEGLMRGIYDMVKRNSGANSQNSITLAKQNELMADSIGVQIEIRDNTAAIVQSNSQLVEKTDKVITKLESIITNTAPSGGGPRNNGTPGI